MFASATTPDYLGSAMNVGPVGGGSGLGGGLVTGMGLGGNVGGLGMNNVGGMGIGVGAGVSGNVGKMPPQNVHFQAAMAMPNKPGAML